MTEQFAARTEPRGTLGSDGKAGSDGQVGKEGPECDKRNSIKQNFEGVGHVRGCTEPERRNGATDKEPLSLVTFAAVVVEKRAARRCHTEWLTDLD